MKLVDFLKTKYNYNSDVKSSMEPYINKWKSWYQGDVKDFHHFDIYNGKNRVPQKRFTMNMAKEISEDWSDILWSEKCNISMKDEANQASFNEVAESLDLNVLINQSIEKSGALGTIAAVVGVYDLKTDENGVILDTKEAKTRVDIVDVDWIFPLSWDNKSISECAFGSVQYVNGVKHIILSVHKKDEAGIYHIYNHLFKEDRNGIRLIENDGNTVADFNTGSETKWFAIFKPMLTNNIFDNSPFGIPHYANAIDNLKSVDIAFDALKNEINDGRRRIFARADMFNYDNGEQKLVFDPNDTTIYQLPSGATKEDLIQSESDDLRTDKQISALNMALNILGNKVGFGENHYHFDGTNLSTATAVVSSNSKMFRRKKKLEIGYESAIYDLVMAICYASSQFGAYNIDTDDMVIQFDDSIIEDKESESARARTEVSQGLLSKVEYRMKIFGETKEIAEEKIRAIEESQPTIDDILGGSEE